MQSISELERLIADLESDRVERKESLSDRDKVRQAICALANDLPGHRAPGYLFVGVNDAGRPVGLNITDHLLTTLADMRSDGNILPIPSLTIQKLVVGGVPVAVVEVQPSDSPPVRFKGQVWIRVGPRRGIATLEEERRLTERQVAGVRGFDHRPCLGSALQDLDADLFRGKYLPRVVDPDVLEQNRRDVAQQLASLRFFDLARAVPTHAGVICFAKDLLQWLPGAHIQFVRFDGETLADPVQDSKQLVGHLLRQLEQLDSLLPIQIRNPRVPAGGLRFEDQPDYPLLAIRELVLNALVHRTYEGTNAPVRLYWFQDHVEVQNPGGLYGQVTPENYQWVSDYRNPVLAEVLKVLGYVERFGTGIARANAALKSNGNPPAEFQFAPTHVRVTVKARPLPP